MNNKAPDEMAIQRANERWQALVAKDYARAYSFNTQAYKAIVSADTERARLGSAVIWVGAQAIKADCPQPAKCTVRVRLDFKPIMGGGKADDKFSTHFDETWLLEDGQWWLFQDVVGN